MSKQGFYVPFYPSDWITGVADLTPSEAGVYINILAMIYDAGEPIKADFSRMSRRMNCTKGTLTTIVIGLCAAKKLTMKDGFISNKRAEKELAKRTKKAESAAASARDRWSKNEAKSNDDSCERIANASKTQCYLELELELDKKKEDTNVSSKEKRGTRIKPDWKPSPQDIQYAFKKGLSDDATREQAERFRDYWISKAGPNGVKLDWAATWRTWIGNHCDRQAKGGRQRPTANRPESFSRADFAIQRVQAAQSVRDVWGA